VKEDEIGEACSMQERDENAYERLVEEKRPLRRPRCKCDVREIGWEVVDWFI
jgi:hypothetical protein